MTEKTKRPVVLCILDGWGYRTEKDFNAIETGKTPNWHKFIEKLTKIRYYIIVKVKSKKLLYFSIIWVVELCFQI